MGEDVKADATRPSDPLVLASGVRLAARVVVSGGKVLRDVSVTRRRDQQVLGLGKCGANAGCVTRRWTSKLNRSFAECGNQLSIGASGSHRFVRLLRGGIARARGLTDERGGPSDPWMLTLETCSPPRISSRLVRLCARAHDHSLRRGLVMACDAVPDRTSPCVSTSPARSPLSGEPG
jgi:hypothetical protein